MTEEEANQTLIQTYSNRLGVNTKRESHGLRVGVITSLHVWVMEESTRDSSSVEVMVVALLMMCGY